jgi:hypothetical protein
LALIDVAQYGAVANNDSAQAASANVAAFNNAFSEARTSKKEVIARKGKYWLNRNLVANSIVFHNEADLWFSDGTPASNAGLQLRGSGPVLNLVGSINSTATRRGGGSWGQMNVTVCAVDFEIYGGGLLQGASCVGLLLQAAHRGLVRDIRVANTKADCFHCTYGTSYVTFDRCSTEGGGDDMFACVSYNSDKGAIVNNITVRNFTGRTNKWGRGMSVVGGHNILYEDCVLTGVNGFGLYIASEHATAYDTRGVKAVTLRRVQVDGCGLHGPDLGDGLRVFGRAGTCSLGLPHTVDGLILDHVTIRSPRRYGALINTSHVTNIIKRGFTQAATAPGSNLPPSRVWREIP